ncbi:MAG: hypothetical protein P9L94_19125 [Candidatus Hinthialibacter antarcticus]|nr:hypothetical protein [Candidatus Hinthialibacter antarcticus]
MDGPQRVRGLPDSFKPLRAKSTRMVIQIITGRGRIKGNQPGDKLFFVDLLFDANTRNYRLTQLKARP